MATNQGSKFQKCSFYDHSHDCDPSTKPACTNVFTTDHLKSNLPTGLGNISELDLIVSHCVLSNMNLNGIRDICAKYQCKSEFNINYLIFINILTVVTKLPLRNQLL